MIGGNLNVLTLTTLPPALYALLARSEHCLEALQAQDDGKFQPVGENWFYTIAVAHTAPAETRHTEFHRQYLDIQIVLEGTEIIDFSWIDAHQQQAEEKKRPVYYCPGAAPTLGPPQSGRFCDLLSGGSAPVRKAIFKIPLAMLASRQ
ncbi:YhcH/YjgK/YiaL family protein [Erwinia tracheiphila]|uniref:YhcH/YjgK/YiaL family protein n=1 Tax=Erwinia tracheiphila TaxID=65700 RepID=UPI0009E4CB19|nr:YhcH/YjgK/YiaL family protein [Erwinia tracheiphila]UIA88889.1 YhcH/YjgK/YiaL family protein [Erwinia tracheiphila]UIA97270.1 YhcH/YjgK/YiaL family protein [Erwinia tracheiphila]